MKCSLSSVCLLGLVACSVRAEGINAKVTPVEKVVDLLNSMIEKGNKEKNAEVVQFASFKQFCEDTVGAKEKAIKKANEAIEKLKADIEGYAAEAEKMTSEIASHEEDVAVWDGDVKAATNVRNIEEADYTALHKDYSESLDALTRAIEVLKKQNYDRKQAAPASEEAFVQLSNLNSMNLIPDDAKKAITMFLQQDPEASGLAYTAPEANAYEFQSGHIIEILEKLLDKFTQELTDLEKEEMNSVHAYKMLMQDLKAQLADAKAGIAEKTEIKAKALQAKADAEGDLSDTVTTRDADEKYVADLTATCETKAGDFKARQKLRGEELEAIQKAIEIISGNAVAGNSEKYLHKRESLLSTQTSFAQLRADNSSPAQQRAVMYLQEKGKMLHSRVLSAVAMKAASDPFKKVKRMIKDLITRLMEEANSEAEHKGWCDTELSTNEQTRKEKTTAVERLHAEIDETQTSIAKLGEQIAELTTALANLDEAMAEATKQRQEEKTENTQTIADAQDGQTAVASALLVLKEFYSKAAEATALLQQQPEMPEIFDSPYKGMQAENGGVIGMLEVIQSDFARLEAETSAAEVSSQQDYDQFMKDSKIDKVEKARSLEFKTAKKQDQEKALVSAEGDLEATQKELDAALAYYDKLKPSCVGSGENFEDRVRRRKEEIESLQDALKILNGEDIA